VVLGIKEFSLARLTTNPSWRIGHRELATTTALSGRANALAVRAHTGTDRQLLGCQRPAGIPDTRTLRKGAFTVKFVKVSLSETDRYWLGYEEASRRPFLGIPLSNHMIDYIEYYWLTRAQYEEFLVNGKAAVVFADACRRRECDQLLVYQPGSDRGIPY
jgi:hypothetical protein